MEKSSFSKTCQILRLLAHLAGLLAQRLRSAVCGRVIGYKKGLNYPNITITRAILFRMVLGVAQLVHVVN